MACLCNNPSLVWKITSMPNQSLCCEMMSAAVNFYAVTEYWKEEK